MASFKNDNNNTNNPVGTIPPQQIVRYGNLWLLHMGIKKSI